MVDTAYEAQVLQMLGDPKQVDSELATFRKDARVLSSKRERLLRKYPQQWIAVYEGQVAAHATTLADLISMMRDLGIPRGRAVVRFITSNPRKMIL